MVQRGPLQTIDGNIPNKLNAPSTYVRLKDIDDLLEESDYQMTVEEILGRGHEYNVAALI